MKKVSFVDKIFIKLRNYFEVSTITEVLTNIEVSRGTYDSWKNRDSIPLKRLKDIAIQLNITVAELIGEESKPKEIKSGIDNFIDMFKQIDSADQKRIYEEVSKLVEDKKDFSFLK